MQLQVHIRADLSEQISLTFVSIMEDIQIKKKAQMTVKAEISPVVLLAWWFMSFRDIHLYACNLPF